MYELDEQLLQETDAMQREQEQLAAAPTCPDDPCLQRQLDTHRRLNVQLQQLRGKWKDLIERRRQLTAESQAIADEVEANEAHQRDVTTQRIELDENIRAYNTKVAPLDAALVAVRSLLAQNSADQMALGPHPPR